MAVDYDWWSKEATARLDLPTGKYTPITGQKYGKEIRGNCRWIPDRDGAALVSGYVHLYYTLKPGFDHGVVRKQLVREKIGSEPDDETWYQDIEISGLVTDWTWSLPPWVGAIEKGRAYRLDLKPRAGIAWMYVTSRYMKAYYLNGLAT